MTDQTSVPSVDPEAIVGSDTSVPSYPTCSILTQRSAVSIHNSKSSSGPSRRNSRSLSIFTSGVLVGPRALLSCPPCPGPVGCAVVVGYAGGGFVELGAGTVGGGGDGVAA